MGEVVTWSWAALLGGLVLPVVAAVMLSTLGLPWLAFATTRSVGRQSLRTRWTLFSWFHLFWAAILKGMAACAILAAVGWLVVTCAVSRAA